MEGMQAFGRRHFAELPRDSTEFVCLECVGSPQLCVVEGEGMLRMRDYPESLARGAGAGRRGGRGRAAARPAHGGGHRRADRAAGRLSDLHAGRGRRDQVPVQLPLALGHPGQPRTGRASTAPWPSAFTTCVPNVGRRAHARLHPADLPRAAARQHAGGLVHLGHQHDLPARRRALEPGGVRRERVLHRRHGRLRGAHGHRRRHRRAPGVVPARHGHAHGHDAALCPALGDGARRSGSGPSCRCCSASGSRSSPARWRRGWWTPFRPPGSPAASTRCSRRARWSPGRPCSPARWQAATSRRSPRSESRSCSGAPCWW